LPRHSQTLAKTFMPTNPTDIVNPGYTVNAITPIILTIDPSQGENGAPGAPGQSINWRGEWATGITYNAYDAVSRSTSGASYIAIVNNTSVDPATDNGSVWGVLSAPGAQGPPGPAGTQYRGAWVSTTSYVLNDLVTELGTTYIAVSPSTGINPSTDTGGTHWQVFAAAGSGGDMYKSQYATGLGSTNTNEVDHAMYADAAASATNATNATNASSVPWTGVTGKPVTMPPSAHETTHLPAGSDPLPIASSSSAGLVRQTSGLTTDFIDGTNTCQNLASAVQPTIWAARLRSFNAIGNPTFEVDQINCGSTLANANVKVVDRWGCFKAGTMAVSAGQLASTNVAVPGTNFVISRSPFRVTLTTQETTLGSTDGLQISQVIEGPPWRELCGDVHSVSLLVRSSVAGLIFSLRISDNPQTQTQAIVYSYTIANANTWYLVTFPNIPVFPSGNFSNLPGNIGYSLGITLAAGSTKLGTAGSWQANANLLGATGMSNFAAQAVNSTFDVAFVQHEPGSLCTTLIDKPFSQNLNECLRYYSKTYSYGTKAGTASTVPGRIFFLQSLSGWGSIYNQARFKKTMAKGPTVTLYSDITGAANTIRDTTNTADRTANIGDIAGDDGFSNVGVTSPASGAVVYSYHYTADTGW
jgi:hypothetical protein